MDILSPSQIAAFETVLNRMTPDDRSRLHGLKSAAAAAAEASAPHWDFDQPGHRAEEGLREAFGDTLTDDHRRALVALWALEMPARVPAADLPPAVMELYPEWIQRLSDFLTAAADPYDRDFWAKDVRI